MKLLTLKDLNVEDSLRLVFRGTFNSQAEPERELEPFLRTLERYSGDWMPTFVSGKRRRKYSRAASWKALAERRDENSALVGLDRAGTPAVALTLNPCFPPLSPRLRINLSVQPLSFFSEPERCRELVELVSSWACHYPASYAMVHSDADDQLTYAASIDGETGVAQDERYDKVYELYWLNVFSPKLVESVGRERVLSTPAWRVEELPNGAVLLVTWPTVADFASEEARQAQARALVHLRPDLELGTVLRTLRERSATLAPVEPRFPPEVAPLLNRVLDNFAISERQKKVAEYNAYQPPEPEEWLPVESAPPSDVEEPARALEDYAELAEHLVALLHSQVPSVLQETPDSLTEVDYHLWHGNFPERYEREAIEKRAVPAVGAYLGEVLVRNLGGKWVPRQRLEEAQVRVGTRAWLPFVRARSYLRSRQALLDYSLTQLYRVAERCRT